MKWLLLLASSLRILTRDWLLHYKKKTQYSIDINSTFFRNNNLNIYVIM